MFLHPSSDVWYATLKGPRSIMAVLSYDWLHKGCHAKGEELSNLS